MSTRIIDITKEHLRYKTLILLLVAFIVSSLCTSCIHDNGWHFSVDNQTEDTLVITTTTIIPDFSVEVNNYDYRIELDPRPEVYMMRYGNMSDTVFALPPHTKFSAMKYWSSRDVLSDSPESDGVTPAWKFIKRMELGGRALSPEFWNTEQKWRITWTYEDVEREYSLVVARQKELPAS